MQFWSLSNISKAHFWSKFEVKLWAKIASSKLVQPVILNSAYFNSRNFTQFPKKVAQNGLLEIGSLP